MTEQPPLNWSEISRRLGYERKSIRPHLLRKKHVPMMDKAMNDLAEWWRVRREELINQNK